MLRAFERAYLGAYLILTLSCSTLSSGCAEETSKLTVPAPNAAQFETQVYPVLVRDCGFPECHGDPRRFFRVFGPGRTRLDVNTPLFAPATKQEIDQSYDRARSMLANVGSLDDVLLLRKPLDKGAGGAKHEGLDNWGQNVYANENAPGYLTLRAWAATIDPKLTGVQP